MCAVLTCLCFLLVVGWYCPLIISRRVNPAPATWIIGATAMSLSLVSYMAIPGRTWIENATLYGATVEIILVLVILLVVLYRSGEFRIAFDVTQKVCLVVMLVTVLYWALHKDQVSVTFFTTQALLVVAYIATIARAVRKKSAFDSIGNWGLILVASLIGSVPAVMIWSPYGIANSVRAMPYCLLALLCSFLFTTIENLEVLVGPMKRGPSQTSTGFGCNNCIHV